MDPEAERSRGDAAGRARDGGERERPTSGGHRPRAARWLRVAGVAALGLAAAGLLWREMLASGNHSGFGDWHSFLVLWEASRVAITRYGELPLYNPFDCGGITLWGNPQLQTYSPWFPLALVIGTTWATKVAVLLHTAIGVSGAYVFARREVDLARPAAALAAVAWGCHGFFAWHYGGGHAAFMPFHYLPWLLLAWRRAADDLRYTAAVAGIFALTLSEGGVYPPAFFVLALAFDAAVRLADPATRKGVIPAGVVAVLVAAPLCAFRILAVRELLRDIGGRMVPDHDAIGPALLFRMFLDPDKGPWRSEGNEYVWPEYASYVGPVVLALAVLGLVLAGRQRGRRWLVAGALLFGATMVGHVFAYAPFAILRATPIYDSLRVPSRYVVLCTFFLALAAGVSVDALVAWLERRRLRPALDWARRGLPYAVAGLAVAPVLWVNGDNGGMWHDPPLATEPPSEAFYLDHPSQYPRRYSSYPQLNLGTTGCYQAFEFVPARTLWWGRQRQYRVERGQATVRPLGRTANTVTLAIEARTAASVALNRNYDPHWTVSPPGATSDSEGLLAVDVPPGRHVITFRYEPASLRPGLAISAVGLLLAALVLSLRPSRVERAAAWLRRLVGLRSADDPPEASG